MHLSTLSTAMLCQGYFLLYESMLDTVLFARDKYLVKDGLIFPDKAIMYVCGLEDAQGKEERLNFWDDVYGFNMSVIKEIAITEPIVDVVDCNNVMTNTHQILKLDLLTCSKEDLAFSSSFQLKATRNDYLHGLVAYFECAFTQLHKPIGWSTSPYSKYTHWKQTLFYLKKHLTICEGETIDGVISCHPNQNNPRDLDINIKINFDGSQMNSKSSLDFRLR
jgi:protein arginine N-methyltransferase 1